MSMQAPPSRARVHSRRFQPAFPKAGAGDGVVGDGGDGEEIIIFLSGLNIPLANTKIETKVSTDWSISVGGRLGWLASESTLLYVLGAYTHQELSDAQVKVTMVDPLQ